MSLRDYLNAGRQHDDKLLLQYQGASWSFNQFFTAVDRLSQWMLTEKRITVGTPVAIAMRNRPEWLIAFVAVINLGAVAVPLNSWGKSAELKQGLEDSEAQLLICDAPRWKFVQDSEGDVEALIVDADTPMGQQPEFASVITASYYEPITPPLIDAQAPAILLFTSGTSGRPKGVMLSHQNLVCNALQAMSMISLRPADRILHVAPMFHIADAFVCMMSVSIAGANYFQPAFDPVATMKAIETHKIERVLLVPTMINMLVNHPEIDNHDLSSLLSILYGASPMPEAVIKKAMEKIPGTEFVQAYGQTEAAPAITVLMPETKKRSTN